MRWEFVGKQELWESGVPGKGYAYSALMWRTPVPGGWLLMTLNGKSNDPQPVTGFYPDAEHRWNITASPEADYLLRPAGSGQALISSEELLRPGIAEGEEPKRLES
jgi:hypothetical protein